MKRHVRGGQRQSAKTGLPGKTGQHSIVIVKAPPARQCDNCREHLIEDRVTAKVEIILNRSDLGSELEVLRFAA